MNNLIKKTIYLIVFICTFASCKKEVPLNPFDKNETENTTEQDSLKAASIEGLYQNIFKPNCSTSGCHDGTFEPDFRTIKSTYNTLVWSDIINNYSTQPLAYRVKPGDSENSMLVKRLTSFVPNTSGIMPLEVSPESDWPQNKEKYIQDLKNWINDGAKDISGNVSQEINLKPQLTGFIITPAGSTSPFARDVKGSILIPTNAANIDIYIGISDKETPSNQLSINELLLSKSQSNFNLATTYTMDLISPYTNTGYGNAMVDYYHKVSIQNINTLYATDEYVFIKVIVNDGVNENSNLPGENTLDHIKYYYSFKRL